MLPNHVTFKRMRARFNKVTDSIAWLCDCHLETFILSWLLKENGKALSDIKVSIFDPQWIWRNTVSLQGSLPLSGRLVSHMQFYLFSSVGWKQRVKPSLEKEEHSPWKASPVMRSALEEEWSLWDEDFLLSLTTYSNSLLIIYQYQTACFEILPRKPHALDEGS